MCLFVQYSMSMLHAQEVSGRVTDGENPLAFATIKLKTLPDSVVIAGGISQEDGAFRLPIGGHPFPLLLEASMLGYTTAQLEVNAFEGHHLTLAETSFMLEEQVVTAQKIPHKLVPGGLSTDIANSPLVQLPDLFSVLRGVPMIEIEGETIKVTGKGSPVIYLNNRLLTDYNQLKLINPRLIDHVEVITNPGAQYSASTQSVLKIFTRREPGAGWSGTLYARAQYQLEMPIVTGSPYVSLNYRTDAWDFFTTFYIERTGNVHKNPLLIFEGRTEDGNWVNRSNLSNVRDGYEVGVTAGTNYTDDLQSFGVKYAFYGEQSTLNSCNEMTSTLDLQDPVRYLTQKITKGNWMLTHRPSLYYLRKFGEWTAQLDADFYATHGLRESQHIKEGHTEAYELRSLEINSGSSNKSIGTRLSAEGPLWGGKLSSGAEYSYTRGEYFAFNDAELKLPDLQSQNNESLLALFLEYGHNIGEKWNISGGLRLEQLESEYLNKGSKKGDDQHRKHTDLFPTVSLSGRVGTFNTQLSFRSHIIRPSFWRLQPQYVYLSRFEYRSGDPTLRSNINYNTQVMINKDWFTLMFGSNYITNEMSQRTVPMPDLNNPGQYLPYTTLLEQFNADPYHELEATVVASPKFGPWQPTLTATITKLLGYEVWHYDQLIKNREPFGIIQFNNTLSLPSDIVLSLNIIHMTTGAYRNFDLFKPHTTIYAQISKSWLKNKALTTSFSVNNLLNSYSNYVLVKQRYTTLTSEEHNPTYFRFTISYRFNTTRNKYKGTGALDSVIDRM